MCICCLFNTQLSLVILGQVSVACSESWYRKLEFCFTSFWFYHHGLWWSSWHAILVLFLLYVFLIWIFSWRDLLHVTGTDASCVLYIICSQLITFEHVMLYSAYCAWFVVLLASPYAVLLRICRYLFLDQFDSSFYIKVFNLSCTDLCKASAEDGDQIISLMVVFSAEIKCNCLYVILSILLVSHRSDLVSISL